MAFLMLFASIAEKSDIFFRQYHRKSLADVELASNAKGFSIVAFKKFQNSIMSICKCTVAGNNN